MPGFTEFLQREMLENKTDEPAAILGGGGDRMGWRNVVVGKPDGRFQQVRNLGLQHLGYLPHVARYIKSSAHPAGSGDR